MDITLANIAIVAVGGAIGAVLRFAAGQAIDSAQFPWATFAVNLAGAFMLSLLTFAFPGFTMETKLFLFTGLFGAFTTLSTFSLETTGLFFDGRISEAGLNIFLNAGLCVFGAVVGRYAGLFVAG